MPRTLPPAPTSKATPKAPPAPRRKRASAAASLREREARQRRSLMLAAVRKLIRKGGAQAVTLRAVAQAVGVSTTLVYAQFADKAALIAQAVDEDLKALARHLAQAAQAVAGAGQGGPTDRRPEPGQAINPAAAQGGADPALQRLRAVAHAYVAHGLAHADTYRLMFMEPRPASPVAHSSIEYGNPEQDAYALVGALVAAWAREAGALPATPLLTAPFADPLATPFAAQPLNAVVAPVAQATQLLWEALHGLTALRICTGDDPWIERLPAAAHVDAMLDALLPGLLARLSQSHPG